MTRVQAKPPRLSLRGGPMRIGGSMALALLLHALLLISFDRMVEPTGDPLAEGRALTVELRPPPAPPAPQSAPPPVAQERATPAPPELTPRPRRTPPIARLEPDRRRLDLDPPRDLSDMIRAARERRGVTEPVEPPPATAAAPQGNEIALENIRRSTQQARGRDGVNGLFQILSKGPRVARFSFRGWHTDSSRQWNQTIEVDAGPGGDVERAIVRKMIELIRQHHNGDFNWDSRRLGRVVTLSARAQDIPGLEDFLMREFF